MIKNKINTANANNGINHMYIYKIYKQGLPTIVSKTLYLYIYTSNLTK